MTEIQGLEGLGEQVAEITLPEPTEPDEGVTAAPLTAVPDHVEATEAAAELQVTIAGPDGVEHDVTEAFSGDLFDAGSYRDSGIPVVDGQATDQLVIAFGGSIKYDASDKAGQDLFNRLRLGQSVTLRVEGTVVDKKGGFKVTAAEEEVVTGTARIKVESLYLPGPSEL